MIRLEDIIAAYKTARKNKRKSPDQVEFELHWEMGCVKLYNEVITRQVRPTAYTFITERPKAREVFASDMATRILHHYLDIRLRPLLEQRMGKHTFNNRKKMGQLACQNALIDDICEVSNWFTQDCYIIKTDISGCFPNIVQDIAYKQLEEVIIKDYHGEDKDELIYILNVCVFSYPTHHCYRKSPRNKWELIKPEKSIFNKPDGVGAAIGHLIWQNAVNYYFCELIDEWFEAMGIKHERFVDDMVFVVTSKTFLLLMPELRQRLAQLGATLNEKKFYCQHYTKGVEWIGVHIKMDRIYINSSIVKRGCKQVRKLNWHVDRQHLEHAVASVNSYLGMCKNVNGYNQAQKILRCLSDKWKDYLEYDRRRVCVVAKKDYTHRNNIIHQFNLVKHYDTTRNRRASDRAAKHRARQTTQTGAA